MNLTPQTISTDVFLEKYAKAGETTHDQVYRRVAKGIAQAEKPEDRDHWEEQFYQNMQAGAIGAGRIMSAAGTGIQATLCNCYVQPVGDCIQGKDDDGAPGIYDALREAAETLRRGGGVGYNFSKIRPRNAFVKGTNSYASGPCSYIDVFDASCKTVESAGCFVGETLIQTTAGLITIKEIIDSPEQFYAVTHLGSKAITAKFRNGVKPVWEVTTRGGYKVKVTPAHKFAQYHNTDIVTKPLSEIMQSNDRSVLILSTATAFAQHKHDALVDLAYTAAPAQLFNDEIIDVSIQSAQEVYDLEVEDVHLLAGNGVYTSNSRRGAQMGVLNIDHPDILEFIQAKRTPGRWNNFNVSVFVSDAFMLAKEANLPWLLRHKAEPTQKLKDAGAIKHPEGDWIYSTIFAQDLWDIIMQSNYDFAEPGILFVDTINNDNNLRAIERLNATNPCAEEPLPDYGCCDLGPINLTRFVKRPFTTDAAFDFEAFKFSAAIEVRLLDDVLDVTLWPLPQQKKESASKRRIGVGFTGLGNTLAMLGLHYDSDPARVMAASIAEAMRDASYSASIDLAIERGAFPLFNAEQYLAEGTSASRLPEAIKERIRVHGIRNSHLLSIAPTGTISLAFADNASNGIEPAFSLAYLRKKRNGNGETSTFAVIDHGLRVFLTTIDEKVARPLLAAVCEYKTEFVVEGETELSSVESYLPWAMVTAQDMQVDGHLLMLKVVQPFIDTSISKTVNIPADYPFDDFKTVYDDAWKYKLKGVATYRPNSILGSVLSVGTEVKKEAPTVLPVASVGITAVSPFETVLTKRPAGELQSATTKVAYSGPSGDGSLYVSVSFAEVAGLQRPVEVFVTVSPGGVPAEWVAAYARNLSLMARWGFSLLVKALQDGRNVSSDKGRVRYGWYEKVDGSKVPRYHASEIACIAYAAQEILAGKGLLDAAGNIAPVPSEGQQVISQKTVSFVAPVVQLENKGSSSAKVCPECGNQTLVKRDGCESCDTCGHLGGCGG